MEYKEKKRTAFLGLPLYFTNYAVDEELISRKKGLLRQVEDHLYLYKVQDVRLTKSMLERIFKLGTVICFSRDVTDSEFRFEHIKNSDEIMKYIMRKSEEERQKRRTINTMELDAGISDINVID